MFALDPEVSFYLLCIALRPCCSCEVAFCKHAQGRGPAGGNCTGDAELKEGKLEGGKPKLCN
jgi:hypothetical protein